jgi:hypothetical protein
MTLAAEWAICPSAQAGLCMARCRGLPGALLFACCSASRLSHLMNARRSTSVCVSRESPSMISRWATDALSSWLIATTAQRPPAIVVYRLVWPAVETRWQNRRQARRVLPRANGQLQKPRSGYQSCFSAFCVREKKRGNRRSRRASQRRSAVVSNGDARGSARSFPCAMPSRSVP